VQGNAELPEVVDARVPSGCLTSCLNGWQQHRHQDADDGNHHQQFYEGKPSFPYFPYHVSPPKKKNEKNKKTLNRSSLAALSRIKQLENPV
jgi:hypothetical protein